jgi:hypothetical protein
MTPTEQWIFCLALVYAVPSFISGVGITLLFIRWRGIRDAVSVMPSFLSPKLTFEQRDFAAPGMTPEDKAKSLLPDVLRLR